MRSCYAVVLCQSKWHLEQAGCRHDEICLVRRQIATERCPPEVCLHSESHILSTTTAEASASNAARLNA